MYRCVPARISRPFRIPPARVTRHKLPAHMSIDFPARFAHQAGLRPPQRPVPRHVQRFFLVLAGRLLHRRIVRPGHSIGRFGIDLSLDHRDLLRAPVRAIRRNLRLAHRPAGICTVNPSALRSTVCHAKVPGLGFAPPPRPPNPKSARYTHTRYATTPISRIPNTRLNGRFTPPRVPNLPLCFQEDSPFGPNYVPGEAKNRPTPPISTHRVHIFLRLALQPFLGLGILRSN